jgi:NitT/TauT family transport system permease protein
MRFGGPPLISLLLLVVIWFLVAELFRINPVVLPTPAQVSHAFVTNFPLLVLETSITMAEAVAGFLLGSVFAYTLAIAFVHSRALTNSLYPYAIALKATPLIAVAPLLILWFGNGYTSKVVMAAMVAFFPVLVNAVAGLGTVDSALLDLMKSLSASWWQVLTKIRVPNSVPYLFAALKTASSLAVVGAVIGEFTGSTRGIGHILTTSSYYLDTALMFGGVIMITVAGLLFFGFIAYIEKELVYW